MKAIVYTEYGPPEVLQLKEVEKPVPQDNEVLIRVYATSVTTSDCNIRDSVFVPPEFGLIQRLVFGLRKPTRTIPGIELAGEIEAIGKEVKLFTEGDQVFGSAVPGLGAYAEYICLPEEGVLAVKPATLTYEEAAVVPAGASVALFFLRDLAHIQNRQKVLIIGASGGVGTYAVQLAKYYGAEVTGVCSTTNLELVKSLGADRVIDYTKGGFAKSGETYDIIFDVVGKTSFSGCRNSLRQKGLYVAAAGGLREFIQMLWTSVTGGKKVLAGAAPDRKEDLVFLKELVEAGKIKPVIDRCYPLEQTAEAHRYVDKGHKKGNVVITLERNDES
jgi:2-desacetyl-2-hydroxyethyl bacteriochlorophyllide A dehydrogenase